MGLSEANRAASLAAQPGAVFVAPTTPDYHVCANIGIDFSSVTVDNPEYTGNIHLPGPEVIGERVTATMRYLFRGPGGASPPALGTWVPGRALVSAGFTELVTASAIPAAAEAVTGGTTTTATLGAGFAATTQLYKGMAINLSANGVYPASLSMIRDYTAAKLATFPETFGIALAGNAQIPRQIGYVYSDTTPTQKYMSRFHFDKVNYDLMNMVPKQIVLAYNTAGLDNPELSYFELQYDAEVSDWGDIASPAQTAGSSPPLFRCGDQWIANKALGGTGFTITIDLTTERAPNPNFCNGDPAEVLSTLRAASINVNHNLKATHDFRAEALVNKAPRPVWAQFGNAAGNIVSVSIPNGIIDVPTLTANGSFTAQQINMFIRDALRCVCIAFPY